MAYPSTFQDLQNAVIAKLRLDPTLDLAKTKDWLNQIYSQVCIETEANVAYATMTVTAAKSAYTLPTAVVRVLEMFVTPVGGNQWAPLQGVSLNQILRWRQSSGGVSAVSGGITHYTIVGLSDFEVYPTPGSADTLTIYYVAQPTALSANGDVSILPEPYNSKLLEYGALAEGADFRSDPSEAEYRGLYQQWMAQFRSHLARLQGNQPRQLEIVRATSFVPHDPSTDIR